VARVDRVALAIVGLAAALRVALACATELTPDEAYYLSAARLALPVPDHPPLAIWLPALGDLLPAALPLELRVRASTLLLGTATSLLLLRCARLRGGEPNVQRWCAALTSLTVMPLAGGFLAVPDAPAMTAFAALLALEVEPREGARFDAVAALAALAGTFAKVQTLPIACVVALTSRRRLSYRLAVALGAACALPWAVTSLRFQTHHAFAPGAWTPAGAAASLLAAFGAQLALWTPGAVVAGMRPAVLRAGLHRGLVVCFVALVALSAVAAARPPEPNWFAPAAVVVVLAAATSLPNARRLARWSTLALGPALALLLASHALRPWLPIPRRLDPAARLHGWRSPAPPADAPGVGEYGPAAETCVYASDCSEIRSILQPVGR
jgi:hypothetical protein